jgi:hypothetical protein
MLACDHFIVFYSVKPCLSSPKGENLTEIQELSGTLKYNSKVISENSNDADNLD